MNIVTQALTASLLNLAIGNAFAAGSPGVEHTNLAFLEAIAAGGGKPLEQLSQKDARAVLTGAQNSVKVVLSGVVVSDRAIKVDGQTIVLKIVRPETIQASRGACRGAPGAVHGVQRADHQCRCQPVAGPVVCRR